MSKFSKRCLFLVGGCALLLPSVSAFAQRLGQAEDSTVMPMWRVVTALVLCLALAIGAAFVLRKRLGGAMPLITTGPRRLQLLERLRLAPHVDLYLVGCDGAELLVAVTAQGVGLLPTPAEPKNIL